MKKILLLGGNANQVTAIVEAKKMGYYTILCDYLPENPGRYVVDKFYLVSTTDKQAVLDVATKECIDGIISYASDVAAPTAAYVAEKLGLPGNSLNAVQTLCNKDKFREFLRNNGFASPKMVAGNSVEQLLNDIYNLKFPLVVKPVDSSSSKGVAVVKEETQLIDAITKGFSVSRSHRVIVEEFIEKSTKYLIGGDIFVFSGKIIFFGLLNCHRDARVNILVPAGKSYPLDLNSDQERKIKLNLQKLVRKLGLKNTALNVEMIIGADDKVYFIDVGPRCGGNMMPEFLESVFGFNEKRAFIATTMGDSFSVDCEYPKGYFATCNLHSCEDGLFEDIKFSNELYSRIYKKYVYVKPGDKVDFFDNAAKALGIVFMRFESKDSMEKQLGHIYDDISIVLRR